MCQIGQHECIRKLTERKHVYSTVIWKQIQIKIKQNDLLTFQTKRFHTTEEINFTCDKYINNKM